MKKILIAEDEPTAAHITCNLCERAGYNAFVSPDGEHAWHGLEANPDVALLITDVIMPHLDGRGLIKRVRESEQFKRLPIIIVSGVISLKEINSYLIDGASMFMPKPVSAKVLNEYLQRLLDGPSLY